MAHDVTFIPGDGTGPELTEATRRVLEATGVDFNWDRHEAGIDEYRRHGNPFPDATLAVAEAQRRRDQGPDDDARRLGLSLDQRAAAQGARPLRLHPAVQGAARACARAFRRPTSSSCARTPRTSTRGSSSSAARADNAALRAKLAELGAYVREDAGISIKPISVFGSERIVRYAFDYAVTHGYKQGRRRAQGEHHEVLRRPVPRGRAQVAEDYPAIDFEDCIIDNLCNQLDHVPGGLRGHRAAEPLRRHRLGPLRCDDRRAGRGGRGEHRHGGRGLRGDARIVADVRWVKPHEPDGADAVGRLHARPPEGDRRGARAWSTRSRRSSARATRSPTTSSQAERTPPPSAQASSPTR